VGNSSNKRVITNVATPTTESDAATKEYADNLVDKDIKYSDFQRVTKS
jgi:hypothetical protein